MTTELVEFLVGLYFIGAAVAISKNANVYTRTVDLFKLVFGIVLVVLAILQGVRLI